MALLVTGVLGDEVEVFAADDQSSCVSISMLPRPIFNIPSSSHLAHSNRKRKRRTVHLGGHDGAGEDTTADRDHAGEWALLVDVGAVNGVLGRAEAQTNVLVPSLVASVLARSADLVVQEDVRLSRRISIVESIVAQDELYLLLVSALRLDTNLQSVIVRISISSSSEHT